MAQLEGAGGSARDLNTADSDLPFPGSCQAPVLQHQNPTFWLLKTLLFSVGLPFLVLSASSPLLQSWFSKLRHARAVDPYFLFAASNAGSLIALIAFPLALEPNLRLNEQYQSWRVGFVVLVILTFVIAFTLKPLTNFPIDATSDKELKSNNKLTTLRRLRWMALSFVPSSLMLGVTTYITADVAAVPLLWVIPLALYLVTFVLAFSKRQFASPAIKALLSRVMFVGALLVTLILSSGATEPAWVLILANLGFFFVAALVCHMQLADDRPSATHLAEYYLWIAIGGALGSVFNVLLAPILFSSIVEYPLAIVIACLLQRSDPGSNRQANYLDVIYPVGLFILTLSLAILVVSLRPGSTTIELFIVLGIPLTLINHFFRQRPIRFALGLSAVMVASVYYTGAADRTLHIGRNSSGRHESSLTQVDGLIVCSAATLFTANSL